MLELEFDFSPGRILSNIAALVIVLLIILLLAYLGQRDQRRHGKD